MKSSMKSQGYLLLQTAAKSKLRQDASAVLRQTSVAAKDPRLAALSMQVLLQVGGHFDKVLDAIDKMVETLRKEEAEDLKNKEDCEEQRMEKTKEARELSLNIDDLSEELARQRTKIEELKVQIAEREAEIKQLEEDLATATRNRADEKAAYEAASADDKAAAELIQKAKDTLQAFYEDNGLVLVQKAVRAPGEAPPPPPPMASGAYGGAKGESTGIQAILQMILDDVEKDIKKADEAEKTAIEEFKKMKEDTEKAIEAAHKAIEDMKGDVAEAEEAIEEAISTKTDKKNTLDSVMEEIKVVEPGCDFIAVNVGVRKTNRHMEIDGLLKAKAILEGAAFGL